MNGRRRFGALALVLGLAACASGLDPTVPPPAEAEVAPLVRGAEIAAATSDDVMLFGGTVPGIDVSHYQGEIDWARVAASGQRFVFAKATEGRTYVDRTYLYNKEQAEAHGLLFGAYHFANPDRGRIDAIREANHFVDFARLRPGNLLPVLDLETTGGLSRRRLIRWMLTWLRQVEARLGVRPIVYTSPVGWDLRVGDTSTIARAGYEHLWVAHWGVDAPTLPADGWNGHGWSVWQRSACGDVPGIRGCVDLNLAGRSLDVMTIPTGYDEQVPTAGVTSPPGVSEPVVVTFDEPVVGISPASVRLRSSDGERVPVRLVCPSDYGVPISCVTTGVQTVQLEPVRPFLPGESYDLVLDDSIADLAGNTLARTVGDVAAPVELEQGSAAITYSWAEVERDNAVGGSYLVEDRPGATATFSFWGTSLTWLTAKGPDMGGAAVVVDGELVDEVDLRADAPAFGVAIPIRDLGSGQHTVAIEILGRGERHAGDAPVVIDAFRTEQRLVETPDVETTWAVRRDGEDRHAAAATPGASAELSFTGTGVVWRTIVGPEHGHAAILVNGVFDHVVDTHELVRAERPVRVSGLEPGEHTIRVVVLASDGAETAGGVSIDGFRVLP